MLHPQALLPSCRRLCFTLHRYSMTSFHGIPLSACPEEISCTISLVFWCCLQDAATRGVRGKLVDHTHVWVPGEVIEDVRKLPKPDWGKLEEMPFHSFLDGIRRRNWTCSAYQPDAVPWKVNLLIEPCLNAVGPSCIRLHANLVGGQPAWIWPAVTPAATFKLMSNALQESLLSQWAMPAVLSKAFLHAAKYDSLAEPQSSHSQTITQMRPPQQQCSGCPPA